MMLEPTNDLAQHFRLAAEQFGVRLRPRDFDAFGVKRQISVRGEVVVDRAGNAHFVPSEPLTFWSFAPVVFALAFAFGAILRLALP